jgi:thiol-disulfide isomerase/thioredoxin
MKSTIHLLFALLFIISGCQTKQNIKNKKTIVTGKINHFDQISEINSIKLIIPDLLISENIIEVKINTNGEFKFELKLNNPTDFNLNFGSFLTYYISPGDSLYFEIDGNCLNNISNDLAGKYEFVKVSGTSEKMNRDIVKFMIFYRDSLLNWQANSDSVAKLESLDFLKFKTTQLKQFQIALESFNKTENTGSQFRNWAQAFIKFDNWTNVMQYRWSHALAINENPGLYVKKMPPEYFDFLKEYKNCRSDELYVSCYLYFLHEYAMYINQTVPQDSLATIMSNGGDSFIEGSKYFLRYYNNTTDGFLKDVIVSKSYYRLLDDKYFEKVQNFYDAQLIEDSILRNRVQEKYDYEKSTFENPQLLEGSDLNEIGSKVNSEFLDSLITRFSGKVVYIDFWAPWCGPCMQEMPNAEKIKKQFEGKNVVFVYLAARCDDNSWKTTIAEQKIKGEHFLLTDYQYGVLEKQFNITGIPRYFLIDKNGIVVNQNAPRPSNGEELVLLIEKYLN